MRYYVMPDIAGSPPEELEINRDGPDRFTILYRGRTHQVDVRATEPASLSLLLEGRSYQVQLQAEPGGDSGTQVRLDGALHAVTLVDELTLRARAASGKGAASGRQTVRSPMPGKVVKILVAVGEAVEEGQPLVVVEAMKMENELRSPKKGAVSEVSVREGVTVEGNAPLVVVE